MRQTPREKQVMMFTATLPEETRELCKKYMQNVILYDCYGYYTGCAGCGTVLRWGGLDFPQDVAVRLWWNEFGKQDALLSGCGGSGVTFLC